MTALLRYFERSRSLAQDGEVDDRFAELDAVPAYVIDARSGPLGEDPSGSVSFVTNLGDAFEGSVTCLAVTGNIAVIGVRTVGGTFGVPGALFAVADLGPPGSGLDTIDQIGVLSPPTDCAFRPVSPDAVIEGDIAVIDAAPPPSSKEQCRNGGWRVFGAFKNQGDCVSFVASGGRNPPGAG